MKTEVEGGNPERAARVAFLDNLIAKGINTLDCMGLHGTSIQAFQHYLDTGECPGHMGTLSSNPLFPKRGDLYFFPFPNAFPGQAEVDFFETRGQVLDTITDVAAHLGQSHHLLNRLELPLDRDGPYNYAYELFPTYRFVPPGTTSPMHPEYTAFMELRPQAEMERLIAEARQARGVIVGISRKVLRYGIPEQGDMEYDRRVNMRRLSPQIAFSGMKLMGELETKYFNSLSAA